MKFDKELMLKHRFWVGLGLALPLTLVGITLLLTSVSAQIAKERSKIEGDLKKVRGASGEVFNDKAIAEAEERAKKAQSKQDLVWKNAYLPQAHLYTWPKRIEDEFEFTNGYFATEIAISKEVKDKKDWPEDKATLVHGVLQARKDLLPEYFMLTDRPGKQLKIHRTTTTKIKADDGGDLVFDRLRDHLGKFMAVTVQRGKYFNDPLTTTEQLRYAQSYKDQLIPVLEQVVPMGFDDQGQPTGVVRLKGLDFDPTKDPIKEWPANLPFLRFVSKAWDYQNDFSEEAWMAQEDIWVQRDIYGLIRKANDMVSKLDHVKSNKPDVETFANPYFTLELKLAGDKLEVTVTNLLKRRQKLDQVFQMHFLEKGPPEEVKFAGLEPLEPAGTVDKQGKRLDTRQFKLTLDSAARHTGIYGVEQALTWETAAVRRIDEIVFAEPRAHSHRTFGTPMRGYAAAADQGDAGAAPGGPPMPGASPMPGGPGGAGKGFGPRGGPAGYPKPGGAAGPAGPAGGGAMVLPHGLWKERYLEKTDQARRIPIAVSLIVDQDHVDRVLTAFNNSSLRFLTTQWVLNHYPNSLRPQPQGPSTPGGPAGPGAGYPRGPFAGGPMPGSGMPGQEAAQDLEANMELVIYGIVTLYERFPPRPNVPGAPAPGGPGAPAAGGPPGLPGAPAAPPGGLPGAPPAPPK